MHSASSTFRPTRLDGLAYIEPFYSAFASHVNANVGVSLRIDLARLTFIHPEGVLALLTAARYWHRLTGQRVLCTNIPPDIHAYLDPADLFNNCATYLVRDTQPRYRLFRSA